MFEDEVETVQKEVDILIGQGINKIIALGHSGYDKDLEVAAKVRGVDIVVGGHSDTFLYTGKNRSLMINSILFKEILIVCLPAGVL